MSWVEHLRVHLSEVAYRVPKYSIGINTCLVLLWWFFTKTMLYKLSYYYHNYLSDGYQCLSLVGLCNVLSHFVVILPTGHEGIVFNSIIYDFLFWDASSVALMLEDTNWNNGSGEIWRWRQHWPFIGHLLLFSIRTRPFRPGAEYTPAPRGKCTRTLSF